VDSPVILTASRQAGVNQRSSAEANGKGIGVHLAPEEDEEEAVPRLTLPSRRGRLDGGQHLGDPDAYRRDRRKDALLQEHGYLVLRFLAEDVGEYLDQVLDAILRALSHQGARI